MSKKNGSAAAKVALLQGAEKVKIFFYINFVKIRNTELFIFL